jgi:predicted permease
VAHLLHDIKYACRIIARDRTFALTAILTLGICIGANTAMFTIVNAVLLRPLPVAEPERLVWIHNSYPKAGVIEASNGVVDYFDRKQAVPSLEEIALYRQSGRTIGTRAGAERVPGLFVTIDFFRMLRARPYRGRLFTPAEGEVGQDHKVVLSYAMWQQQFGGRDDAIGQDLRINGVQHTVIGVMPPDFLFDEADIKLWLPLAFTPEDRSDDNRHSNSYSMVGRLRPGATIEQAQREIDALNAANLERFPNLKQVLINAGFHTRVAWLQERLVREVRGTLYLLWGGVVVVLLIGCVNITNLTLVRATARAREFATRQALGAGGWQLMRQLLTESLVLTSLSGALGLAIGYWGVQAIVAAAADRIPRGAEIAVDGTMVLFTVAVTIVVGSLIALLPLVNVRRISLAQAVREEGRSGTAGRGARVARRALVTAQVAFAFMLLVGAGLLFASFRQVLAVNPGFDPAGVVSGMISLPAAAYAKDDDVRAFVDRAMPRLRALPGVQHAGLTSSVPFGDSHSDSVIFAEGYVAAPGESLVSPSESIVTPGYFEALRIPLKRGRFFDGRDTPTSQPVIIVDERLAAKFWPGRDPIGKRMYSPGSPEEVTKIGPKTRFFSVVGVVGSVKEFGLVSRDERVGAYYFPHTQRNGRSFTIVARSALDPLALAGSIRQEIAALDPEMPFYDVHPMEQRVEQSVAGRRTAMVLAVGFGFIALMLATVGIYGVLAYQVSQRTREIGIRMALGSDARTVFGLILREGATLLAVGFVLGLAGAFAMRRAVQGELYGVDPMEPGVVSAVAAILAIVALVACALPARRAARIDPVIVLSE